MMTPPTIPGEMPRKPLRLSPELAAIQDTINAMAKDERVSQLVDYLDELRTEFAWTAAELKAMGFCAPCYLSDLEAGDDHDCVDRGF
jgi:hypothetical protein